MILARVDANVCAKCIVRSIEEHKVKLLPGRDFERVDFVFPQLA